MPTAPPCVWHGIFILYDVRIHAAASRRADHMLSVTSFPHQPASRVPQRPAHARTILVVRLVLVFLLAFSTLPLSAAPALSRDAQTVIHVMLSELGANRPSGCPGRWCACYLDTVLVRTGLAPHGSNIARDFATYGDAAHPGQIGAIMVMPNHVGVVVGGCENGQVQIVSGNYSNTVAVGCYNPNRAIAWRAPVAHDVLPGQEV